MSRRRKELSSMPPMGPGRKQGMKKPKDTKKTAKRLFSYFKQYKLHLLLVVVCVIISSGANVYGTYLLKPVIDDYIVPFIGRRDVDLTPFIVQILIMLAVYILGALSSWIYNRVMVGISCGTLYTIRNQMFSHMEKLPIKYFDTHATGDTMSRYTNDADSLRQMLSQSIPQLISSVITVVSVFVMMVVLSPLLTLLVIVMLIVILVIIKFIGKRSAMYFRKQQNALGAVNGYTEEMIEGVKVVKVFCYENKAKSKFSQINGMLAHSASNANTFASILMPIMGNLSNIHYALTAILGAYLTIISGNTNAGLFTLSIGALIAFLQYTRSFSQPITQVSQQINSILNAMAGAERIFELLDEETESDDGKTTLVRAVIDEDGTIHEVQHRTGQWAWRQVKNNGIVSYSQLKGEVDFEHVTFSYDGKKTVLNDISLYANPGQKIAFVGSTGAGKTTITNLINRFYDVPDGKIKYDGININTIKKSDLRRSLGIVLQDTHLFTGTVMENIRFGKLDATDDEVINAAKIANAHWFISHLPDGYNTWLTADGSNLSQGQRQLIAIARAAVADPPVLILDEATSSIDTRTESLIEKGMDGLMQGRTTFVIAHRLSTVRNADAIMVLENGEIIERGNHEELIAKKGRYYQLYTGAFELS